MNMICEFKSQNAFYRMWENRGPSVRADEIQDRRDDRFRRIFLHQMLRFRHDPECGTGNAPGQFLTARDRYPVVIAAPQDRRRATHLTKTILDFDGEAVAHLSDLAIEGGLPNVAEPRLHIERHLLGPQRIEYSAAEIGAQDRVMDIGGQPGENLFIVARGLRSRQSVPAMP